MNGTTIYPAAGMLVMAIEAVRQIFAPKASLKAYSFRDVAVHKALVVPQGDEGVEVHVHLRRSRDTNDHLPCWNEFQVYTHEKGEWSEHCQGYVAVENCSSVGGTGDEIEVQQLQKRYQLSKAHCTAECQPSHFYRFLDKHGTSFGPCFQRLNRIRFNDSGETIANTDLQILKSGASFNSDLRPYFIHPVVLDAIFQSVFPALSQRGRKPLPSIAPTLIRSLSIFGPKSYEVGNAGAVNVLSKTNVKDLRNFDLSVAALYADTRQPCIIGDIEITAITSANSKNTNNSSEKVLGCHVEWKPDLDLLSGTSVSSYCYPAVSWCKTSMRSLEEEKLSIVYGALEKLYGARCSLKIAQKKPHFARYLEWVDHQLAKPMEGLKERRLGASYNTLRDMPNIEDAYNNVESSDPEGKLLVRVARRLSAILCGDTDDLELLFKVDLMTEYYRYVNETTPSFQGALSYFDTLAHKHPDMKILEIGAGTGGATGPILETLTHGDNTRFATYAFTEISPDFFDKAKARFKHIQKRMVFSTLNVELDPTLQGFETDEFDVVVASNVSLADRNICLALDLTGK